MLSKKGFTLVKLLVTMVILGIITAILGIITAMSFPVLKTLSENINEKKLKIVMLVEVEQPYGVEERLS